MTWRRGAGIDVSGARRIWISRTIVGWRLTAILGTVCRVCGRRALRNVILWPLLNRALLILVLLWLILIRALLRLRLIRARLILIWALLRLRLIRARLILIWALLRLILPRLILILARQVLILPLLIPVLRLVRRSILTRLGLGKARLLLWGRTGAALAHCHNITETQEQDRCGDCHRTHSFRVGSPVHESFSRRAAEMSRKSQSPFWLPVRVSI